MKSLVCRGERGEVVGFYAKRTLRVGSEQRIFSGCFRYWRRLFVGRCHLFFHLSFKLFAWNLGRDWVQFFEDFESRLPLRRGVILLSVEV